MLKLSFRIGSQNERTVKDLVMFQELFFQKRRGEGGGQGIGSFPLASPHFLIEF